MDVWMLELLKGIGRAFMQPYLYIAIIVGWILANKRIKKERQDFGTRVFPIFSEMKRTWGVAIGAGLVLSIIFLALGLVVPLPFLFLLSAVFLLVSLPMKFTWYSAAYTLGFAYILMLVLPFVPDVPDWLAVLEDTPLLSITAILAALLLVEAILLLKTTPKETFPEREKGKRGLSIGQHRARKIAVVPFLALFPAGDITSFAEWWPLLSIGGESYGLILIPFLTGFEWIARGQAPEVATKTVGRHIFLLAVVVLALTIGSYFLPILSFAAIAVGLLGREWITIRHRIREDQSPFFYPHPRGVHILGIIPGSPADQMGLVPGEVIERVNQVPVRTESQFYEALQVNGAFNKLEVRDQWGENRYVQRAMYEGEHFELGVLFVEPPTHEESVGFF
ncbi:PDZ domain-containing protein [Halobacillus salinus]|uniref:PDZ domain-containing protein n=1 Tax=Halobacillus salinus TaxID=192814 RepID=UPI0009A8D8E6|nr:PDZ domain-containing protein [Halobacillus salinus]